ncbi:hypothetical protein MW722_001507 [Acinetobacter baumannii]|nr:hypothetical protein [Acinetobacter baumannii]AVE44188.1 hypothetical protein AM435_00080 [Acinetobacter baumannii]AVN03860.1 hypothetical protein C7R87_3986 [Acinetobacter baumannii]EKT9571831.1 hypothetical protein [Acinetobacter baumannii]EKU0290457.1 hypothetical protein [Acinetobacter baumannii]EKV6715877.1 hypothetical protein [Acinetobacter baumannii]
MSNTVRVIGIDPSLKNFGIVVADVNLDDPDLSFSVVSMNLIKSEENKATKKVVRKNSDDLRRAKSLHDGLKEACKGASFAICEVPVGSQSARAMASYGICIGVLSSCPLPLIQVTPTEVKLAGTGIKTATKGEMIEAAMNAHPEAKWPMRKIKGVLEPLSSNEHLADATFAIKAGLDTDEFKSAIQMLKQLKNAQLN